MKGKRVFILGAGFSNAAGMPLSTELTTKLINAATQNGKYKEMNDRLKDLQKLLRVPGCNDDNPINIEEFFHYASIYQEICKMRQHLCPVERYGGDGTPWVEAEDIGTWLNHLQDNLRDVLLEEQNKACLDPISKFAEQLCPDDAVLTFNYDTLLETALTQLNKRWHHGLKDTTPKGIAVLKLHGSLDWMVWPRNKEIPEGAIVLFLKSDANATEHPPNKNEAEYHYKLLRMMDGYCGEYEGWFGLVDLGSNKPLHLLPGIGEVWDNANDNLREAEKIYVIGYSFSAFDAHAHLYFSSAIQQRREAGNQPRPDVFIVDPNVCDVGSRFRKVFGEYVRFTFIEKCAEEVDWRELLS